MDRLRIVHAADFHLDAPFRGGRPGYGSIRRQDVRQAFSATIELALSEAADVLLLCGDLFEQDGVTRDTIAFVRRELDRLGTIPALLLPGNHDPLTADSWYRAVDWPAHVHLLDASPRMAASVDLPACGVFVAGFGFAQPRQESPDFSTLPAPKADRFNLLLLHGSLDAPDTSDAIPYNPVTTVQLAATGYDYAALGHYHAPFEKSGRPWIVNPGSPEPMGFDEPGTHGAVVAELVRSPSGMRVSTRHAPLASREYVERTVDVSDADSPDAVKFALAAALAECLPERCLPHVRLTGMPAEPPDLGTLADWFDDSWLLYRITDDTRPPVAPRSGFAPESLAGIFYRRMDALIGTAEAGGDASRAVLLRHARQMGLEALAYGEVHRLPERQGG